MFIATLLLCMKDSSENIAYTMYVSRVMCNSYNNNNNNNNFYYTY
jgi:hypothetical protein